MVFETTTLGEFAKVQGGFAYKSKDFASTDGSPVLKIKNVRFGNVDYSETAYISAELAEQTENWSTSEGDILISMTGSGPNAPQSLVGRVARVWKDDPKAWINQRVGRIVVKSGTIHPDFIFYLLTLPESQDFLVSNSTGSANQANISGKTIELLPCPVVGFNESEQIASIIRGLDEKIILNRQTNQTLENMAQALFKSWFVDFDPVIDNALVAGNTIPEALQKRAEQRRALREAGAPDQQAPTPLPEAIRQLFPASFVFDTEMGWIPEGWEIGTFSDIASHVRANIKPENINDEDIYVGLEHIGRKQIFLSEHGTGADVESNKSGFQKNDLLFGKLRPYFHKVCFAPKDGICSTDILVFRAKSGCYHSLMALTAYTESFVEYANLRSTGTRMPRASAKDMLAYQIVLPPEALAEAFEKIVQPMWDKGFAAVFSNDDLTALRDTLLPKLISGELRIPETQNTDLDAKITEFMTDSETVVKDIKKAATSAA